MRTSVSLTFKENFNCQTLRSDGGLLSVDPATATSAGRGHSPLELLALAHGTCTAMMMAKAGINLGLNLAEMQVEVVHNYRPGPPMLLETAQLRFHLPCSASLEQVEQLKKGASLCPVHSALRNDISVTLEVILP
jgi:uncharacterized OsmC-like protein